MNIDTGELDRMHAGQRALAEKIMSGMQQLPKHLSPFAEAHMEDHPGEPVDLEDNGKLAYYAREQRAKRAANASGFGKCKNRPV